MASPNSEVRQPGPRWVLLLSPALSTCALGVLGFACAAAVFLGLGVGGKERDLALFVVGALLLAPACAAAQVFLVRPDFQSPRSKLAESANCWSAVVLLLALSIVAIVVWVAGENADFWFRNAMRVVVAVAGLHLAGLTLAVVRPCDHRLAVLESLNSRMAQVAMLVFALFVAGVLLFWVDPSDRYLSALVRLFLAPPFAREPGRFGLGPASMLAVAGIAAVAALGWLEAALIRRGSRTLRRVRIAAHCVAVTVIIVFFDFSLAGDVAHYLANIGPALHLLSGGTLLVDTFSQYGPGPVLITLVGFQIGPVTFGTAQVTAQVLNIAFYGVWLVCLHRMTRWKLAGLLLGIFSIAFFLAGYIRGYGNVNEAPSIVALRYLPTLLMVLALSCLRPPQRHSLFTALITFVAGAWSVETLVGTLGVHVAFLGLLGLRDRAIGRLLVDGVRAVVPAVVAGIAMMLAIRLRAGTWPDLDIYLQYFFSYNPGAAYWSVVANPMFFGWLAMLLAVFVVLADAWTRVFNRTVRLTDMDDAAVYYRFVPMVALLMLQAAYFVGRSYPSALSMAVLPFCAIAIPAALAFTAAVMAARGPARLLALIPVAIGLWMLTFTFLSLFRQNSPYSLVLHECRDLGRCSPAAIAQGFNQTLRVRPTLERVRRPIDDGLFDVNGIVRDAVSMMTRWAGNEPNVTVLLGRLLPQLEFTVSELALMYAGKWDRWPRSLTPTDELVPALAQRIIAAPVRLREGELVLVRRDEAALGLIEGGILKRIRSDVTLCRIPDPSREVVPYRVAGPFGCPPGER